jgi:hypothetical protein
MNNPGLEHDFWAKLDEDSAHCIRNKYRAKAGSKSNDAF